MRNLLLCLLACLTPVLVATEFVIGWEDYPPYQLEDQDGRLTGLDVELLTAIAATNGDTLAWRKVPWKRHLQEVEQGTTHLAASASPTEERAAFARFSAPYREEMVGLFVTAGANHPFSTVADLAAAKGFRLGVVRGYVYGDTFEALRSGGAIKARLHEGSEAGQLLEMLAAGRLDGVLIDAFTGAWQVKARGQADRVVAHDLRWSTGSLVVMFSRRGTTEADLERFNAGLARLRASGEHQRIIDGFLGR